MRDSIPTLNDLPDSLHSTDTGVKRNPVTGVILHASFHDRLALMFQLAVIHDWKTSAVVEERLRVRPVDIERFADKS